MARVVLRVASDSRFAVPVEVTVVPVLRPTTGACGLEAELVLIADEAPAALDAFELLLVLKGRGRRPLISGHRDDEMRVANSAAYLIVEPDLVTIRLARLSERREARSNARGVEILGTPREDRGRAYAGILPFVLFIQVSPRPNSGMRPLRVVATCRMRPGKRTLTRAPTMIRYTRGESLMASRRPSRIQFRTVRGLTRRSRATSTGVYSGGPCVSVSYVNSRLGLISVRHSRATAESRVLEAA